jgi:RHS repeat-associated protein
LTSRQFSGPNGQQARLDVAYTADGQVSTLTRYSNLSGTTKVGQTQVSYDAAGNLTHLQHQNGSNSTLLDLVYSYDAANRLSSQTVAGTTTSFGYDHDSQLTSAGGTSTTFDPNGNRTISGYVTGVDNRLLSDGTWTYQYDAAGNITSKRNIQTGETWTYTVDLDNKQTSAIHKDASGTTLNSETLKYDAFGQLIEQDVTNGSTTVTRFALDLDGNVWADLNGSNQLQMRRLYLDGPNAVFARLDGSGNVSWYLADHLSPIVGLTNASGSLSDVITYDAWGNFSETQSANGDRDKFATYQYDVLQGDSFAQARRYNPTTGRFENVDPLGFAAGDVNTNRYVGNDPTNAADPSGLAGDFLDDTVKNLSTLTGDPQLLAKFRLAKGPAARQVYETAYALAWIRMTSLPIQVVPEWMMERIAEKEANDALWRFVESQLNPRAARASAAWSDQNLADPDLQATLDRGRDDQFRPGNWAAGSGGTVFENAEQFGDVVVSMFEYVATGLANHATVTVLTPVAAKGLEYLAKQGWKVIAKTGSKVVTLTKGRTTIRIVEGSCFPANTPVLTQYGLKPIQAVRVDDQVWGYNLLSQEWVLRAVIETSEHDYEGELIAITVGGEVIEATSNHPFWVVAGEGLGERPRPEHVSTPAGPASPVGNWVAAGELRVGDTLLLKPDCRLPVTGLVRRMVAQKVYNFEVEEVHTYAVGVGQVLVHNKRLHTGMARRIGALGPSGKASTEKYLEARWDQGTFGSVKKSIEYHVEKHGKGRSAVELTQSAEKAWRDTNTVKTATTDLQGRPAIKVRSEFGDGLFTPKGKIIWFE